MQPLEHPQLRSFLVELPVLSDYKVATGTRKLLAGLFYAASCDGKYLPLLFPERKVEDFAGFSWENRAFSTPENDLKMLSSDEDEHSEHSHPKRPCARRFRKGDPCYRCLTCGFDDTCALCSFCFEAQDHEDHQVLVRLCQKDNGGVCDCGDPEAWTTQMSCPLITEKDEEPLPEELYIALETTLAVALDHVLDVMAHSTEVVMPSDSADKIRYYSRRSALNPAAYLSEDTPSEKYMLVLYNDQVRQFRDAVQRVRFTTGKVSRFAEMVVQRVDSYGRGNVMGGNDLEVLLQKQRILCSTGLTSAIRSYRDVFREELCDSVISWIENIVYSKLFQNKQRFRDLVCRTFLRPWRQGCYASVLRSPGSDNRELMCVGSLTVDNMIPRVPSVNHDSTPMRWDLSQDLCNECFFTNVGSLAYRTQSEIQGSRFQMLLYFDVRFWKSIRSTLHNIYIFSLISNLRYKLMVTAQYVDIYPQISELFLSLDREPESSLMSSLSAQLFTCPSNSTNTIRHGDLSRMLTTAHLYLTTGTISYPPAGYDISKADLSFKSLKNRKWGHMFFDMTYILGRNQDNKALFSSDLIDQVFSLLKLFQGRPTMSREATAHVEYESNDYGIFFNSTSVVAHFAESISKSANALLPMESGVVNASITKLLKRFEATVLQLCTMSESTTRVMDCDVTSKPFSFMRYSALSNEAEILKFDVHQEKVSFLHPVHSLISSLLEMDNAIQTPEQLTACIQSIGSNKLVLIFFDFAIRKMVLLSQIKVGQWVRNGFSVRNQMNIYRNTGIREFGFVRDLFLAQCFLATQEPSVSVPTVIERWKLIPWILGDFENNLTYGKGNTSSIVEECLLFFINILNDTTHLMKMNDHDVLTRLIEKEIIQTLCFRSLPYSKLCSEIEHLSSEKRFLFILRKIATLVEPRDDQEHAVYKLKAEYFNNVDPYFIHYTSNKREEALRLLRDRFVEKTKRPSQDFVFNPPKYNWDSFGPYAHLPQFILSLEFSFLLKNSLAYCIREGPSMTDAIMEFSLHLLHICMQTNFSSKFIREFVLADLNVVVERNCIMKNLDFNSQIGLNTQSDKKTGSLASVLYTILTDDSFASHHSKIKTLFHLIYAELDNNLVMLQSAIPDCDVDILNSKFDVEKGEETQFERKKKLAKKKRFKIMAQFKKQQDRFVRNHQLDVGADPEAEMDTRMDEEGWLFEKEHCILCQMTASDDEPFGFPSYVFDSAEFRYIPPANDKLYDDYWFLKAFSHSPNLDARHPDMDIDRPIDEYLHRVESRNVIGPGYVSSEGSCSESHSVTTSCCHGMHFSCYLEYVQTSSKTRRSSQVTRTIPEDFSKSEFLCPLCKSLNNVFVPVLYPGIRKPYIKAPINLSESETVWGYCNDLVSVSIEEASQVLSDSAISTARSEMKAKYGSVLFSSQVFGNKVATSLLSTSRLLSYFSKPHPDNVVSSILAHSIESIEISLRGTREENSCYVFSQVPSQTFTMLRAWCQLKNALFAYEAYNQSSEAPNLQGSLKKTEQVIGLMNCLSVLKPSECQKVDLFETLVSMQPTDSFGISFNKLVCVCFVKQTMKMIQSVIGIISEYGLERCILLPLLSNVDPNILNDCSKIYGFLALHRERADLGPLVYTLLVKLVTPFLRRAAIWTFVKYASLSELPDPSNFDLECDKLCAFLGIPSLAEIIRGFVSDFERDPTYALEFKSDLSNFEGKIEYPGIVSLINLPYRLSEFFTEVYHKKHLHSKDPAICLFCAAVLDLQGVSLESRLGECNIHIKWKCMRECGLFLLPRSSGILMLYKGKGSFFDAPYVDLHGELDEDSKRSEPLFLSQPKYEKLVRNIWLGHNIPNEIARKLESLVDIGGWETM
ncbi:unnamed protein product [Kuraishia capsulata CBS 1993]|uniref:E3 ubiquitin-protein ligase n=1 Tax=Kuraishia capsulata CBS 1993 TaxID=1382522 RepID=W6MVB5_9ASCO|nr:uncharacterized protein KUCA_T00002161001 [Kuraishia capsulata CBS 1993]CDK26190.1 unnamed protein product [Kuraishia capsulata CBS 1993]